MCFSPEADAVAGLVIGVVGIDTLRHVRQPAQLPLALLPVVFAVHQLVEVFVWLGLQGRVPEVVGQRAEWLYLAIAFGVLPALVPVAVSALEPVARRGRMAIFVGIGALVAVLLMYDVARGPIAASIRGNYIQYDADLWHGGSLAVLYVLATCGTMLLSAHRHVQAYGVINLVAVLLLAWLNQAGFISLWCLWAAVTSVAIAVHLRYVAQTPPSRSVGMVASSV
jgi:hypothetical protein